MSDIDVRLGTPSAAERFIRKQLPLLWRLHYKAFMRGKANKTNRSSQKFPYMNMLA